MPSTPAARSPISLLFGSAQRDRRRFDQPDRFDVGRGDSGHIGFGGGIHFCLGAAVARVELEVALRDLAQRLPTLEFTGKPRYQPTFVTRGLAGLEIRGCATP